MTAHQFLPVLAAAAFAQHIPYGPVLYENLLLTQTAEISILPLPLCFKAVGEAMVVCALVPSAAFRSLV